MFNIKALLFGTDPGLGPLEVIDAKGTGEETE
jgi:hypothetical protein